MNREEIERLLKQHKPILSKQFYVNKIGLFGSYIRNEQTEDSDIDILVEFNGPIGWDIVDFKDYLESLFSKPVDLVTAKSIKPYLKEQILSEVEFIQ